MESSTRYVLVLDQQSDDLQMLESLLQRLYCSTIVATSTEQMIERASQAAPSMVILAGQSQKTWSRSLMRDLRHALKASGAMIIALTDYHSPSWLYQEDNPGFDGFLVAPLNPDVLSSLVQSAWARQTYCGSGDSALGVPLFS